MTEFGRVESTLKDFANFCRVSMTWCASEAEQSTSAIIGAISLLLQDSRRITTMSKEAVEALTRIKAANLATGAATAPVDDVIKSIRSLAALDAGVAPALYSIVEALQFQDKVRQNMENLSKMYDIWLEFRQLIPVTGEFTDELRSELGRRLMTCTTMKEERDTIRFYIRGLPDNDVSSAGDAMLF